MAFTTQQLQATLESGDVDACVALFSAASETERQTAAALAERHFKKQSRQLWAHGGLNPLFTAAQAAVLAACTLSQIKKLGWRAVPADELAFRVLSERRPTWLDDWAHHVLDINPRNMPLVRRFVQAGLCPIPEHDNYWLGLLDRFSDVVGGRVTSIHDALLAQPRLLDDVWRLFEIEGNGEFSLAACDKYTKPEETWATALAQLAHEGYLPRARLLDASLDTLARDFAQFRAGWFSRFHELLEPTLDERAARAERYLALLASKIPPTVSFALNAVTLLDRAGRLEAAALANHVAPVLTARAKGTVLEALKLLENATARTPARKSDMLRVAVEALRHEAPDVQGAVLGMLERHASSSDKAIADSVRALGDNVAASQRTRVTAWLGAAPQATEPGTRQKAAPDATRALLRRAAKVDARLAQLAGVKDAVAAVTAGIAHVPAIEFTAFDIPQLHADRAMVPIAELDELIDRFAAVLEDAEAPDDVERVLDGVSRLCADRPDDFASRTGPLAKRAKTILKRRWGGAFVGTGPVPDLCGLAIAWTSGAMPPSPDQRLAYASATALKFLAQRVRALAERARHGVALPLLAAPTHRGAWINPCVLAERVHAWPEPSPAADVFDQVQALLRLAPEHRAAALRQSEKLSGEFGLALRHALGANGVKIGPTAALWAAAARARAPHADDLAVEKRHPDLGPDAGKAARLSLTRGKSKYVCLQVKTEPDVPKKLPLEFPTVLLHAGARVGQYRAAIEHWDSASVRWTGSIWPACREPWFAAGALLIGTNLDWWEASWGNRAYLEPLLDADTPLSPMASLLLAFALACKEPGESGLATDALIAAIADGRLDGLKLGASMATVMALTRVKLGRWAKNLSDAARISPLHAAVIALALERALQELPDPPPKDLHALLEALKELRIAQGASLALPESRAALERLQVAAKTAKLVREILALEAGTTAESPTSIALEARLERAARWAI